MTKEQGPPPQADQPHGVQLTGIHLDVQNKRLILAAQSELVATLTLTPEGVIFDARTITAPAPVMVEKPAPEAVTSPLPVSAPIDAETEKPKAVTLQGKLKSKPQAGRPDSRGKPTAWARFAAHEEEHDGAHLYSTTFHKHTVEIALGLEKDTPLTVQGYPHLQEDPGTKRLDTLSVINLLEYPGKAPAVARNLPARYTESQKARSTRMLTLTSVQEAENDVRQLLEEESPTSLDREDLIQRAIARGHREDAAGIALLSLEQQGLIQLTRDGRIENGESGKEASSTGTEACTKATR